MGLGTLKSLEFFNGVPRIQLAQVPTPLLELKKLSTFLGGPRIFMKREDLIGFAMGGNKVRKFEFFMADALQKDADCCVAIGAIQSNHVRVTAASALHCGIQAYLLLMGDKPLNIKGNLLMDYLLGAEISYIPPIFDFKGRLNAMLKVAKRLTTEGHNPYVLHVKHPPLGCLGPVMAMEETLGQTTAVNLHIDRQFVAIGSGETLAGLMVGAALYGSQVETVGVCIGRTKEQIAPTIDELTIQCKKLLIGDEKKVSLKYSLTDAYMGKAGFPTEDSLDAIRLVAKTEGIFLDPIYTGKAMVAMLDMIRKKKFSHTENLLFWNTSSPPSFFSYDDYLAPATG